MPSGIRGNQPRTRLPGTTSTETTSRTDTEASEQSTASTPTFAPYDDMRKVELQLLDEVIAADKTDPERYSMAKMLTGDHPALGNWMQEGPGLKRNTESGSYPFWESGGSLE